MPSSNPSPLSPDFSDRDYFMRLGGEGYNGGKHAADGSDSGMDDLRSGIRSSVDNAVDLTEDAVPVFTEPKTDHDPKGPHYGAADFDDQTEVSERPPAFDTIVPAAGDEPDVEEAT